MKVNHVLGEGVKLFCHIVREVVEEVPEVFLDLTHEACVNHDVVDDVVDEVFFLCLVCEGLSFSLAFICEGLSFAFVREGLSFSFAVVCEGVVAFSFAIVCEGMFAFPFAFEMGSFEDITRNVVAILGEGVGPEGVVLVRDIVGAPGEGVDRKDIVVFVKGLKYFENV